MTPFLPASLFRAVPSHTLAHPILMIGTFDNKPPAIFQILLMVSHQIPSSLYLIIALINHQNKTIVIPNINKSLKTLDIWLLMMFPCSVVSNIPGLPIVLTLVVLPFVSIAVHWFIKIDVHRSTELLFD